MDFLPAYEFQKCVSRYRSDHKVQNFSCRDQFLSMAFAQLTYRESLRDIETCLQSIGSKLYHMGVRSKVARSTLADANESRDWRIDADLDQSLYALDSTTIDLCLSLFPWAKFREHKAAVKMHTLLVAIARKRLGLEKSLYQILQIFSITSLEKVPILQVFEAFDSQSELLDNSNQLILFGL